ncbi:MAG: hypothetical protein FWG85_01270 [Bacteroidetes bacterium]|nr:hypothetical protein [Bacteroidota bacterium]
MLQKICLELLNEKWNCLKQIEFPLNAKKIAAIECFNDSIRQFFFAEIIYYCRNVIKLLADNNNISSQLLNDEDIERLISILYDWVEFDAEKTKLVLENAIQTELLFLINPAKCLAMFLYKRSNECIDERTIKDIIKELDFINDQRNIVSSIKEELLEISNQTNTLSQYDFTTLINDIVFNITQNMELTELLLPLNNIQTILSNENIPMTIIDIFFAENDLAGILTKIKEYATNNEKESLSYSEILDVVNDTINSVYIEQPEEESNTNKNENIETPDDLNEYIEDIELEVDNTINEIEEDSNQLSIIEDAELEVDNTINEIEEESNQLSIVEDAELEVDNTINEIEEENNIENAINLEDDANDSQKESITEILVKLRSEDLNPIEIEKNYLEMEKEFLTNFKYKLLGYY